MKLNVNGIFGVIAIGLMIWTAFYQQWHIDWLYFVVAIVGYLLSIVSLELAGGPFQAILGCHLAFFFLIGGMWLSTTGLLTGFFLQASLFLVAVAM